MSETLYKVGTILENSLRQFAKVISIRNGVYGISGWSTKENAEKATVAYKHINSYGLKYANVRVVESGPAKAKAPIAKVSSTTTAKGSKSEAKAKGGKSTKKSAKVSK